MGYPQDGHEPTVVRGGSGSATEQLSRRGFAVRSFADRRSFLTSLAALSMPTNRSLAGGLTSA